MSNPGSRSSKDEGVVGTTPRDSAKMAETRDERTPKAQKNQADEVNQDSNQSAHAFAEQFSQLVKGFHLDQYTSKGVDPNLPDRFERQLLSTPDARKVSPPTTATRSLISHPRIARPYTPVVPPSPAHHLQPYPVGSGRIRIQGFCTHDQTQ